MERYFLGTTRLARCMALGLSDRIPKPNRKLGQADLICYALTAAEEIEGSTEPRNFKEAHESEERQLWLHAMEEELEALRKNNT